MSNKTIINKFGGEIMGSAQLINLAIEIIKQQIKQGHTSINVVSACAGVTDELELAIDEALSKHKYKAKVIDDFIHTIRKKHFRLLKNLECKPDKKLEDKINQVVDELSRHLHTLCQFGDIKVILGSLMSYGERLSSLIMTEVLRQREVSSKRFTAENIGIITNDNYIDADIIYDESKPKTRKFFKLNGSAVAVVCGFCGKTKDDKTTVLGRGGSDTTACYLGSVLKAEKIYLWKTVDGVLSADPRIVHHVKTIKCLTYYEASESGKVIHDKAMQYAMRNETPVVIANINNPKKFTTVKECKDKEKKVKMITYKKDRMLFEIHSSHMDEYGFLYKITEIFTKYKINMNMIRNTHDALYIAVSSRNANIEQATKELKKLGHYLKVRPCVMVSVIGTLGWRITHEFNLLLKDFSSVSLGAFPYRYCTRLEAVVETQNIDNMIKKLHKKFINGEKV
jgi:aspartate kinase